MSVMNIFTCNSIISALTRLGFLDEALRLFWSVPEPDQCSWNSMVYGFAQHGRFEEAIEWLVKMHKEDFCLNEYSFGRAISACSGLLDLTIGMQVHGLLSKSPYVMDVYMDSALVDMYAKCGDVSCARKIFDGMRVRNVVTWNSLITCYELNEPAKVAIEVFVRMMDYGVRPDEVSFSSVVSACATLASVREGIQIHSQVVKVHKYRNDTVLSNALVDMYAKCGRIAEARQIFDRMPIRNVIFETSMVCGYAKASSVVAAKSLFLEMEDMNIVSWNALMAGYTQNGENEEAFSLFILKLDELVHHHILYATISALNTTLKLLSLLQVKCSSE